MEKSNDDLKSAGDLKIEQYVKRIQGGEPAEEIFSDLPEMFISGIKNELEKNSKKEEQALSSEEYDVPAQYEGLPSFVLEEIWTIPIYADNKKTESELNRKARVVEMLKRREAEKAVINEKENSDKERISEILQELGVADKEKVPQGTETPYNRFSVANGETDTGVFWYQYRNKKAKELKESKQFEWGKERIYFDIKLEDMIRMRDLVMKVSGEEEIPVAFKHLDDEKTFQAQKDGKETRFVVNFATEDDAKKFLLAIKKCPEYSSFISDRNLSHDGIRIDGIAEYASGFREGRSALERIMNAAISGDGTMYTYKAESGKDIIISPNEYETFRRQYEKFSDEMSTKESEWRKYLNS